MSKSLFEPEPQNIRQIKQMHMAPWLKIALEMGPLLVFFFANYRGRWLIDHVPLFARFDQPIYPATALFMLAILLSLALSWLIARKLPVIPLASGLFVLVFGFLTLWLHDEIFIKMKPTIINALFGLILFGGLLFRKPLLGYIFDSALQLDAEGWQILTWRWAWFFLFLAALNEIVWRNFNTDIWTNFKVFGTMPLTILFILFQTPLLMRHSLDEKPADKKRKK
ncbi:MAG: septation protein A [Candidatus Tokpelaia sp.]|uniref:septation protein A n=1 Tax=Candidatus Tokpelaia sp. TaxID=2233777 RepID=UPI00123A5E95|nr:septation protein A [Candidatus Tokpelaia sp.]KAA6206031.1 MAG: septation protein A [Candidatus Tokpelaia sp.]KAA6206183.1 MAG: septation protein A [Candidatus Tokpelaia sp.]KAA6406080.1 septation protein A [Candidatus Tokpelaia sp.]